MGYACKLNNSRVPSITYIGGGCKGVTLSGGTTQRFTINVNGITKIGKYIMTLAGAAYNQSCTSPSITISNATYKTSVFVNTTAVYTRLYVAQIEITGLSSSSATASGSLIAGSAGGITFSVSRIS